MRHFLCSGSVAALPVSMGEAPTPAVLVALAGTLLRVTPREGCAISGTVTVATVAMATDQNPRAAASAKILTTTVLPSCRRRPGNPRRRRQPWTNAANR